MKRTLFISAMLLVMTFTATAQEKKCEWKERMLSEKIAFITTELSLSQEEAQAFWPVYNASWEVRDKARKQTMAAYKALSNAIAENKNEAEISRLLDEYIAAITAKDDMEAEFCNNYKNVLSVEKVAKLYVAEEKFRREQIHRLHKPHGRR